ncbi:MAG: polyprenyl synthetase family protein [Chlamydiia bacterium]|nr:polyprenyl synthetase family protein [Chlamydiia bacterium]
MNAAIIDQRLETLVPHNSALSTAVRYSLLAPGKRLRPLLVLTTVEMLGGDPSHALDPACAIEMIHNYSLIHDDLPCMDDDDLRRGLPTLHKVAGDAMALLAGDFLLTYAFEILTKAPHLTPEQRLALIEALAYRAGGQGMIGGQAIDITVTGQAIDEPTLVQMHLGKTGALLTACLEIAAIITSAPTTILRQLQKLGADLGLAYQFLDDLLNATSTTALLGKQAGSDANHSKPTAITLFGVEGTKHRLLQLKQSIEEQLREFAHTGFHHLIQKLLKFNETP